jgi:hypothetical protein
MMKKTSDLQDGDNSASATASKSSREKSTESESNKRKRKAVEEDPKDGDGKGTVKKTKSGGLSKGYDLSPALRDVLRCEERCSRPEVAQYKAFPFNLLQIHFN